MRKIEWSEEEVNTIIRMASANASNKEMSEATGKTITHIKNLIVRLREKQLVPSRLGLVKRGRVPIKKKAKPMIEPTPEPEPLKEVFEPNVEPITIMQLKNDSCRWPVGNSLYCGAPKKPISSYCEYHFRRSLNPNSKYLAKIRS